MLARVRCVHCMTVLDACQVRLVTASILAHSGMRYLQCNLHAAAPAPAAIAGLLSSLTSGSVKY